MKALLVVLFGFFATSAFADYHKGKHDPGVSESDSCYSCAKKCYKKKVCKPDCHKKKVCKKKCYKDDYGNEHCKKECYYKKVCKDKCYYKKVCDGKRYCKKNKCKKIPEYLKDGKITVELQGGGAYHYDTNDYKVVKRKKCKRCYWDKCKRCKYVEYKDCKKHYKDGHKCKTCCLKKKKVCHYEKCKKCEVGDCGGCKDAGYHGKPCKPKVVVKEKVVVKKVVKKVVEKDYCAYRNSLNFHAGSGYDSSGQKENVNGISYTRRFGGHCRYNFEFTNFTNDTKTIGIGFNF